MQPSIVICPKCRTQNASGERFCRNCGARLCLKCHNIVPESSRYCPNCMAYFGSVQHEQRQQTIPIAVPASKAPDMMPYYTCPQCGTRVNGPKQQTRCPKCGFLGDVRYQDTQQQTINAAPIAASVPPMPARPVPQASSPPIRAQQSYRAPDTSPQNKCPHCGASVHPYSRICPSCGKRCGTGRQYISSYPQATATPWETRGTAQVAMSPPSPATAFPQRVILQAPAGWGYPPPPATALPGEVTHPMPKKQISPPRKRLPLEMLLAIIATFLGFFTLTFFIFSQGASESSLKPTETPTADSTPPVIQNVSASSITKTSTTISWETDKPATSQVMYCQTNEQCFYSPLDRELVTNHFVTLSDLKPGTAYHITALSKDANENEVAADLQKELKTSAEAASTVPEGLEVGYRAPDFTLENLTGQTVSLGQFRGKLVMVNFWFVGCGPCEAEMPHIQEVRGSWSSDKLVILAVNHRQDANTVRNFINPRNLTFTVLLDPTGATNAIYGVSSYPKTFFINTEGVIKKIQQDDRFYSKTEIENILKSL